MCLFVFLLCLFVNILALAYGSLDFHVNENSCKWNFFGKNLVIILLLLIQRATCSKFLSQNVACKKITEIFMSQVNYSILK